MLKVVLSNQFKRDLKIAQKRGLDIDLLTNVVNKLANKENLPPQNKDHNLIGEYAGYRECHVQPDWLLVYKIEKSELLLFLFRTGTHSDLFR